LGSEMCIRARGDFWSAGRPDYFKIG